ncbi:TRAP transporter substrate-binding protein DctP [Azospira restricta]|uniref:TRAP transporter substrate-binding protein DctP n=1 Tax=Azospira restricta TaxID=404405 RepID=A0A974SPP3_9RHOO|nr:TRAP transporter substrate-binding protein DctP [Azospira restricta]QRJ64193.1 TRAP transporter substrate-binding protein DctP [Azospira restricta]
MICKTKRCFTLGLAAAALAFAVPGAQAQAPRVIKISHQFPAASSEDGDFRDRLVRRFAAEVEKQSKGSLKFEIYPGSSLMKTNSQIGALRKGALDMSLVPLAYGGGEIPEVNITLMPTLVNSYEQGLRWKTAPIGKELERILAEKNIKILTWVWQAGGIASTKRAVAVPEDAKGLKFRGGSKEMDQMLKGAGAAVTGMPSSEIYSAMQSGVLDAALTSSTSLISFRLQEFSKFVTTARDKSFWFMFEPLLISKSLYDSLTPEQQKIVADVGASLEKFGVEESKKDDQRMADVYAKAGAKVVDMDEKAFLAWRAVAEQTAFKDFAENIRNGRALLDMALAVK